jgi:tRNA G18 (ribose-2'-O)-methylase SpoU
MRSETRRERYNKKRQVAQEFPLEICTCSFQCDENIAYVLRAAACFGCAAVNVIGSLPQNRILTSRSGSLQDYIQINQHASPHNFLEYARENNIHLISAELDESATSIHSYAFPLDKRICIIVGHETLGVPVELLLNSDKVFIDMPGTGYSLNTSQCANIFLYEITKRYRDLPAVGLRNGAVAGAGFAG